MTRLGDPLGDGDMYFPELHNTDSSCPPSTVWKDVVASATSKDAAMPYLRHAASCHSCSDLLAATLDPDAMEATPEEEAFLEQLTTSSPAGQRRLAAMMYATAKPVPVPVRAQRKFFTWPVMTLAAAAALLVAGFVAVPLLRQPGDDRLIAQAYDRNRLSELRIPGSTAVDLASPTRGAGVSMTSAKLLELKLRAQQQFEQTPNDPAIRQKLGEIAIVEHDGESARRQFEMADALKPTLPRLKLDMANAYFELAETNNRPLDYARAIDFFGQYLQTVQEKDPVALFDRGLSWERQSVNSEAIKDFEAALALEKDPGWRKEIQRHIDKLKAQSALDNNTTPYTPAALLAMNAESSGDYENFLDSAGRDWLGRRSDDPQAAAALQKLSAIGARHRDLWLHDFLAAPAVPIGDGELSRALEASARGDADTANVASANATRLYDQAHNRSGALRARAEHVYSLQRMGHTEECLAEAAPLRSGGQLVHYAWMQVYLDLEVEACNQLQGKVAAALVASRLTTGTSSQSDLPIIGLRAASFLGGIQYAKGDFLASWNTNAVGVSSSYHVRKTSMRRYQFLESMEQIAGGLSLNWTQAGLADAAADAALRTADIRTAAYALEASGAKQLGIGATVAAGESFTAADRMLARLGPGRSADVYRADWQADRSAFVATKQGPASALSSLGGQEEYVRHLGALYSKVNFYTEYASLQRRASHSPEAIANAWLAVGHSEQLLAEVKSASQRPAWQAQTDRSYRVLSLALADSGQTDAALRSWEWYRGANYRTPARTASLADSAGATAALLSVPAPPQSTLTLVYARLEDHYAVWTIHSAAGQPIRMQTLAAQPDAIESEALAFHRLCADPNSSQQDIVVLGNALDRDLIAPVSAEVDAAQSLEIDIDTSLAGIPFAAIQHHGAFLGISHSLLFLQPGWPYARKDSRGSTAIAGQDTLPNQPHLLIVRQTIPANATRIPDQYDETADIAKRFPDAHMQDAVLQRSGQSLSFSGGAALRSAVAATDILHYTGHGLEDGAPDAGPSGSSVVLGPGSMLRCRLAVLAACRTFDQREAVLEDVPSFTRILLEAGASRVLATQWDVDSRMTHRLMVRLYAELADHQSFTEALRRAQQSLQSDPSASHPYFWSAFQLVGQS